LDAIVLGTNEPLSRTPRDSFDVLCWNIERGHRIGEIARYLSSFDLDVCLLQEADRFSRRTRYLDIAAALAETLHCNWAFAAEFEELAQGSPSIPAFHGNAILSPAPIEKPRIIRFRNQPHDWGRIKIGLAWLQPRIGGRLALIAEIPIGRSAAVFYNLHLESRATDRERLMQVEEVLTDISSRYEEKTPIVLAGDLNTAEGERSRVVQSILSSGFQDAFSGAPPASTKVKRKKRLDWVFVRHLAVVDACVLPITVSDHFPLWVRIKCQHALP
jgi:endonuclease/exonuclease/phosphatase family metal-dependent hydrolase